VVVNATNRAGTKNQFFMSRLGEYVIFLAILES
jgi:hypothetical protein